jgi:hypothetical protein
MNNNAVDVLGHFAPSAALIGDNIINYSITAGPCVAYGQTVIKCGTTEEIITDGCGGMGCWSFGAKGNVYTIPNTTIAMPNLDLLTPEESVTVDDFSIFNRSSSLGYPGLPDRLTWYAIRFTGFILLDDAKNNTYKFRLTSDDGAKFYIDDTLVVNNDSIHSPTPKTGSVCAESGWHGFKLDWFQGPATQIALALEISYDNGITWSLVNVEQRRFQM